MENKAIMVVKTVMASSIPKCSALHWSHEVPFLQKRLPNHLIFTLLIPLYKIAGLLLLCYWSTLCRVTLGAAQASCAQEDTQLSPGAAGDAHFVVQVQDLECGGPGRARRAEALWQLGEGDLGKAA